MSDGSEAVVAGRPLPLTRRALLGGGAAATLALAIGCGAREPEAPLTGVTVESLTSNRPFYLAYQGGAADWPEMSAFAYQQAAQLPGLAAMDVSVCQTADGVLVCSYDETTKRLTGKDLTIVGEDWSTLSRLTLTARETSDVHQPRRPLARLEEVLEAHIDRFVFCVEPRVKEATGNLMASLIALNRPDRIIWKQPVTSARFAEARRHGFATLGYVLDEPAHLGANLVRFAAAEEITLLGVSRRRSDSFVTKVSRSAKRNDKQLVTYDVKTAADRARVLGLGCTGIASSHIRELLETPLKAGELPPLER